MIVGVDHILIAVEDMDRAMEAYRRLGFQVTPGGEHPRMGTFNSLVPLGDGTYLELIGVRDPSLAERFPNSRQVVRALSHPNRIATFALLTNDMPADILGLRARGLNISDPIEGERMRPDGQKVAWRSAHFENPGLPFLIQDITPRNVRVPEPSEGVGKGAYLSDVSISVTDVGDASRVWKNMLGRIPPRDDEFRLERCTIRLLPNKRHPSAIEGMTITVGNFQDALQNARASGVALKEHARAVALDPVATVGAPITLAEAGG